MANKQWLEPEINPIPVDFQRAIGGIPLVSQMLYRLGLKNIATARGFLDESLYQPTSPLELPDLGNAVDYLADAIKQRKKISVWGDFDVDGQTATTLLISSLRELGAIVDYHIPIRANESHGINIPNLEKIIQQGTQILLTCDTGVASSNEIDYAQSRGVPVIITDHHDLPSELPKAFALIDPKRLPADHPLGNLPGVGVAYQLIDQLCLSLGRPEVSQACLDLVALGIVADLAMIKRDTRWLLQQGLKALKKTKRLGLQTLYEMIEINPDTITEEHIGFYIAPRLNAVGRLSDANPIVEFLTTTNAGTVRLIAAELEGLNAQRKLMTDQVFQAAQSQLETNPDHLEQGIVVLHNPAWPAGVIGIVASRLVERYNLPTILLSTPPGQPARGSARSIEGVNITEAIAANQHMLITFGGHPMAAGLSIEAEKIPEFQRSLARTIRETRQPEKTTPTLQIDSYFPLSDLSIDLVAQIERLSPFGPGNPAPILATRSLNMAGYTSIGRNAEHLLLTIQDEGGINRKVIWWQGAGCPVPDGKFDMAYTVRSTQNRGQQDVQVEWVDYRTVTEIPIQISVSRPPIRIIDYRLESNPRSLLEPILNQESVQIWCEGVSAPALTCQDRLKLLTPCKSLVLWTIPPGPIELKDVLEKTVPEEVYMFGVNPDLDQPEVFLKRLAGLLKFALATKSGKVVLPELAAASSHRISTIRAGIAWLANHGHITVIERNQDKYILRIGTHAASDSTRLAALQLKTLLEETAAFRAYYLKASPDALISL